ncbi:MAG: recombination protein F [Citromicrobium sp.]|nr:MAG: recombination protein F [Citromicrobium sp.]
MSAFEFASNKAFAAVFAFGASALLMAYAIVPAGQPMLVA